MTTSRKVDLELGELAIAMEKRVYGSVSMEPVAGAKNRDPLDHRPLAERLAIVSPHDAMLPFDPNADAELVCVSANNGLCGISRHSLVPQPLEKQLQAQLLRVMGKDRMMRLSSTVPGPPADRDSWAWTATESEGALLVMVRVQAVTEWFPVAAFAVGEGKRGLLSWEAVWLTGPPAHDQWPPPPSWETDGPLQVPTGRWLSVRLLPSVLSIGLEASWLIGFSQCVAWSWLLLGRPPAPIQLRTKTESPLISRWSGAIARSVTASSKTVEVEPGGWRLAASDGTPNVRETCLTIFLWPPEDSRPGAPLPIVLAIRPGPGMDARIDRHPGFAEHPPHPDLDAYVKRVLVAAAGVYWAERGLLT